MLVGMNELRADLTNIPSWQFLAGVTTNSATATNCASLYDLRGIH